ncbi:MAG: response regulator [bacterium]|nr:response regulator [bacterium]
MEKNKKSILIVEDDTALRKVLNDKLSEEGFEVFEAVDGEQGLKIAKEKHPTLILLDIFMPIMDGVTMLSKLRSSDAWGKHVLVLVLTNSIDAQTIAKVSGLGTTDFLIKSEWSLEALVGRIRERVNA